MFEHLSTPSLLVALPGLTDPHFARSVVLLVQQGREGSLGFVINRPVPPGLRDAGFQKRYRIPQHIPIWLGGPVATNNGAVIHNEGRDPCATFAFDELRVSVSEEAIDGLIESVEDELQAEKRRADHIPYRFVIGQASWEPKQLEAELKAGFWIQRPLDEKLLFRTPFQEIWSSALQDYGVHPLEISPNSQNYLN